MMKNLVFLFFLFFNLTLTNYLFAQDKLPVKFGKIKSVDFDVKAPAIDSDANAVVIADWGYSQFIANTNDLTISLQFTKKTRIKIVNKNGFDAANISIYLYNSTSGSGTEKLESLKAYTYNINKGEVTEAKVDNSSVFTERKNKNWIIKKFSFPELKEGSIIEYSYTINSPFIFNLQPWEFQGKYPCLWSEYNADIPEFYKYVTLSQGYQTFFINKIDHSQVKFTFREKVENSTTGFDNGITTSRPVYENFDVTGFQDNHQWVMKNVPGLKPESFVTTLNNHSQNRISVVANSISQFFSKTFHD